MTEDSPEPTDSVKVIDSPLPAADPQPNLNTFGLPLTYTEPAYDPNVTYQSPQFTYEENLDQPQPPSPPPLQPGQSRQWRGETEIN